ncbi:MAG: ClpXP protease specificity-enhancing factor [Gammaproteobacteria bacterium]|nr:ClpXP protease specificity-enhancing factor [Gammaproteobacteria bacterium]
MRSARPYLIRALIDWIVDNDWTPHLLIAADVEGVVVPREHVREDRIVLNISARAVREFVCEDAGVSFDSRFGGRAFHVVLPLEAVLAVYARESGAGLAFHGSNVSGSFTSPEADSSAQPVDPKREGSSTARDEAALPTERPGGNRRRPTLTVIE